MTVFHNDFWAKQRSVDKNNDDNIEQIFHVKIK
jgi:hypothetical protein